MIPTREAPRSGRLLARARGGPRGLRVLALAALLASAALASGCAADDPVWSPGAEGGGGQRAAASVTVVRMCSWNLRRLGDLFDGADKDYATAARILDDNCDASALLEVMQKGGYGRHPGYDQLMAALGAGWDGMVTDSPRPDTSSGQDEFYALVWRRARVAPCAGWSGLERIADNDGSGNDGSGLPDRFLREPAFGCLDAQDGDLGIDFMVAAYHAVYGTSSQRRAEVASIDDDLDGDGHADDVFGAMRAARPGEEDLFILGDFNLNPSQLADALPGYVDETTGAGSTLNSEDGISGNLYDHVVVPDLSHTPELAGPAEVLDVRDQVPAGKSFYETVSDHLPVRVDLHLTQPDDDPPGDGGGGGDGDYYAGIDPGATGEALATELHDLIGQEDPVAASKLLDAFTSTDTTQDGCDGLFDLFTGACWNPAESCGRASAEGDCYSRVKLWPPSWWGGDGPAATDLFNLRPIDGYVASRRSNNPLGPVDDPTYVTAGGGRVGPCSAAGAAGTCFEPPDSVKGDLARSFFYMAVRYRGEWTCCTEDGVDGWHILPWLEAVLRDWDAADPVSDAERRRNDAVFDLQGNRNPFIDHPEWVDAIGDF